jgi:hypothetical protein
MKASIHDWEEISAKATVKVSKKAKLKRVKDKVVGPQGHSWPSNPRVCQHDFVHPADWEFFSLSEGTKEEFDEFLCPHGCFEVNIKYKGTLK